MPAIARLIVSFLLLTALAACAPSEPKLDLKGTDVTAAGIGGDFTLTDQNGQSRKLSGFPGKAVALFFGYTHCPDVCPTSMLEYAAVMKKLGPDADKVQVLFVTVDPERDTREVLAGYVPHFDKRFLGLTGSAAQIEPILKQFRIVAQKVNTPGGGYTVDHSAGSYLLDPQGKLRVYEAYGTQADVLAHDISQLLR